MRFILFLPIFIFIFSCNPSKKENHNKVEGKSVIENIIQDSLFKLHIVESENFVRIDPQGSTDFSLPDSSAKTEPYKIDDFNADGKSDVMIYMGACGAGGVCMYSLFLKQDDAYYRLAFMEYLKGAKVEKDKEGFLVIKSFEEVEAYDPSKLQVSVYTFNQDKYLYELDSTFVESY